MYIGPVRIELTCFRGNHLSNTTSLAQFSSNVGNTWAIIDDP